MGKVDYRKQRTKCHFSASTQFPHGGELDGHKLSYRIQDEDQGEKLKYLQCCYDQNGMRYLELI